MDVLVLQRRSDKQFLSAFGSGVVEWSPSLMEALFMSNDWLSMDMQRARAFLLGARVVRVRMEVVGGRA